METNENIIRNNLSESAANNVLQWLHNSKYGMYREELMGLIESENWRELEDSFFKKLEFGTAGRRGKVGIGSNRLNLITVGESAQALAEYLNQTTSNPSVAIACDTRISSKDFTEYAAATLAKNGVKVFMFSNYRSTPELSFAVRHLETSAGIVISASHNPPEDNGIKVYWSDGAQISAPHDEKLMEIAANIDELKIGDFTKFVESGDIEIIGRKVDRAYITANVNLSMSTERNLKIVYSPLHGTGMTNLLATLEKAGFEDVNLVEEQAIIDGSFPFVAEHKPNPESPKSNTLVHKKLLELNGDIAITTDPDADRVCVSSLEKSGEIKAFNGNESAILAADFLLSKLAERGELKEGDFIAKSIVTTDALNALAAKYGVKIYDDMLVGFKYIGRKILEKQQIGERFLIGAEESFGQLVGDQVRDKDAATAGLILAELAAELKITGKTLGEKLGEIYAQIGYFAEETFAFEFIGAEGFAVMQKVLSKLRNREFDLGGLEISALLDYETLEKTDYLTGDVSAVECTDRGNVIVLEFSNRHDQRFTIRPSGTEPKLRIYGQWKSDSSISEAKNEMAAKWNILKERILN
ncbi:MAG: phospho-sugar mutase [Candidatus Sacchiramonaceae bacterium]|nr:phospho-sugar mutase [Candidatus Saccharimonadaceae bacterium]